MIGVAADGGGARELGAGVVLVAAAALASCGYGQVDEATAPVAVPQAAPSAGGDGAAVPPLTPSPGGPASAALPGPSPSAAPDPGTVFARVRNLALYPPADRVAGFAFHESLFQTALNMVPSGRPGRVDNPEFHHRRVTAGPGFVVMASRGRDTGPATSVDIVVKPGTTVVAPVDGTVVDTSKYLLYCQTPDHRVAIEPTGRPAWRVVLFHLSGVSVKPGDSVVAGQTPLGKPHVFTPHSAQYDEYVRGGHPHVHLEVEDAPVVPTPGCPISGATG